MNSFPDQHPQRARSGGSADSGRILILDGIRGFGLCMVLVQHFFGTRDGISQLNAFDRTVWGVVDSGWWAIDSFFVLSVCSARSVADRATTIGSFRCVAVTM